MSSFWDLFAPKIWKPITLESRPEFSGVVCRLFVCPYATCILFISDMSQVEMKWAALAEPFVCISSDFVSQDMQPGPLLVIVTIVNVVILWQS